MTVLSSLSITVLKASNVKELFMDVDTIGVGDH